MLAPVQRLIGDRGLFCQLLPVTHKGTSKHTKFSPLPAQKLVWDALDRSNRVIVLKARQMGVSTAVRAWQFHRVFQSLDPVKFAVLSFHQRSATNLRRLDREWLKALPDAFRRELREDSAADTIFDDTGAGLSAFTTGGRGGTRSFSFTGAHLSEFAFYQNPDEVLAQVLATVGDGPVVIESTVNVPGDAFHRLIEGSPENGWELLFLPWFTHQEYRHSTPPDFKRTSEEEQLTSLYGLDDQQLMWRRTQVLTLGPHKFAREFPACIDDCFVGREGGWFEEELLRNIHVVEHQLHGHTTGREIERPQPNDKYVMGVDVGGGVGGDYSALAVVSATTMQPVYAERNNKLTPQAWAHRVVQVAARYNNALVLTESNNHGHALLLELQNCHYTNLWHSPQGKPWVTTLQSKLDALNTLRESLQVVRVMDRVTWLELRALTVPAGKVAPEAPLGGYDDSAMALALAYRCMRDVPPSYRHQLGGSGGKTRVDDMLAASRARRIRSAALPF
jgi:hypothetical protein